MKIERAGLHWPVIVVFLAIVLAGCGAIQNLQDNQAAGTEKLLMAAGFRVLVPDNPEKQDHLRTLTQQKLLPVRRHDRVYYLFADASVCQCLYIGDEKAFQRYRGLAAEQQLADQRQVLEGMESEVMWDAYGPWGPWGSEPWY
jgi:hypothetical protein